MVLLRTLHTQKLKSLVRVRVRVRVRGKEERAVYDGVVKFARQLD
jgi:hypothetical protein